MVIRVTGLDTGMTSVEPHGLGTGVAHRSVLQHFTARLGVEPVHKFIRLIEHLQEARVFTQACHSAAGKTVT